ncbi:MAG: hypothetical protein ACYTFG_17285 [Planctomycetota bacterium]|jgi:hypothetical protein
MRHPTRLLVLSLVTAALAFSAAAHAEDSTSLYDLSFTPKPGKTFTVTYEHDKTWNHPKHDMKGALKTTLEIRWKILAPRSKEKGSARGEYLKVSYAGEGVKKGKDFRHDILWDARQGYTRGKNDEANVMWVREEIEEGLPCAYDSKAVVDPGSG